MDNATMTERLQWEIRGLEVEIKMEEAAVLKAAEQLQWRAQRAIEESKDLVEGRTSSLAWIEFVKSDVEEAKRSEGRLQSLREKHKMLSRYLEFAQQELAAE